MQPERKLSPDSTTTLHIKNMVCNRCIKVVGEELEKLGFDVRSIVLGEVVVAGPVDLGVIRPVLEENGFELIEDQRAKTIEHIKQAVLKLVRRDAEQEPMRLKHSEYIAHEVGKDYHSLSTLFSSIENVTIEQYIILQRIERAKELLKYGELTLSEISYKLGYSSVQHLSNQFKKVTGMTPGEFKKLMANMRKPLDKVIPG
ncbi:helix-turn-helix domain-containing protein [Sphingobacteriales bacterium CHB3]|nr:helix-turn-helix domain-containing protein [Sphingobacteriales bacterium CHB3]